MSDREVLTWAEFGPATRMLAEQVVADGYRPELLLCIARGGLLAAGALSYALDVKNVHLMNVEFYTGVDQRLAAPVLLPPVPQTVHLSGARVLVVDDVADTGATLTVAREHCVDAAQLRFAVLYEKPHSQVRCEYVWRRTDTWIDFPWSSQPPVVPEPRVLDA